MLNDYKQLYRNSITNKELLDMDKNELLMKYVETGNENYLSAAIYKFWYILNTKLNNNQNNKFIEPEDIYEMFIDSIMETCKNALWNNEEHSLYQDKKAPEKSINTIFSSKIINHFHACNRQKRKSSFDKIPLNEYTPNAGYYHHIDDVLKEDELKSLIVDFFSKKDYYSAYILDIILNNNVFDTNGDSIDFNRKKLKHHLMNIDNSYCQYFANNYNVPMDKINFSLKYVSNMSYDFMDRKIKSSLGTLMRNEKLIEYLNK